MTAEALILIGAPPYSRWTLLASLSANATPFAAALMMFGLASVSREEFLAAKDLGARTARIIRRILAPALLSASLPAFAVSTLMAASDVSASTMSAGPEPYLAPLARHALNAGLDQSLALRILAIYLAAAAVTALTLTRALRLRRASSFRSEARPEGLGPASTLLGVLLALAGLLALLLLVSVLRGLAGAFVSGAAQPLIAGAVRESLLVLLLVVPIAALSGFITALSKLRRLRAVNSLALVGLLSSPVAGGILVRIVHGRPIEFAGRSLIPPLVGAGSPAGGLLAVLIANLLLAVPAAHFLMMLALSGTREARRAAEDAGAGPWRTVEAVIIPMRRGRILAALAALCALVMSMSAPAVFVVPVGSSFPAVALLPHAVHGSSGEVLSLGALGGASALVMLALGAAALIPTLRRPHV